MANSISKPYDARATPMQVPPAKYDDQGTVDMDTWVQAPKPSKAAPYKPSIVPWVRGMGKEEAKGIIQVYHALVAREPDFYRTRKQAALAVVRAYQVLHQKKNIPQDILQAHWGGQVPDLKGNYYYSLTQIVRAGPDCKKMAEAMEKQTGVPYVAQLEAAFTSPFEANAANYSPTMETLDAVKFPKFISSDAAVAYAATSAPAGAKPAPSTPKGKDHASSQGTPTAQAKGAPAGDGGRAAKRSRASTSQVSPDPKAAGQLVPAVGRKTTTAARAAVKHYLDKCAANQETPDLEMLELLYAIPDKTSK